MAPRSRSRRSWRRRRPRIAAENRSRVMADRLVDRVLIVGWDGLRPDLVVPERTPNLCRLIERGVRWVSSTAAFPSETRPNNATIGTGCYPGRHGITANHMLVPEAVANGLFDSGRPDHLL